MAQPTPQEITRVKALGFLHNRGTDTFSARAVSKNGTMSGEQLRCLAQCAQLYGNGQVCFTARLTVEMPGIHLEDVEKVRAQVAQAGLVIGGTGAKVRPLTACKGTTCVYGNADTQAICAQLYDHFFVGWGEVTLPHKFKIAVGGCPNSCMKPSLNDFGIEAHRAPVFDRAKCRGCQKCQVALGCPLQAAQVAEGKLRIDQQVCSQCGVCIEKCPFGAFPQVAEPVFALYVGGTWGKHTRMGTRLNRFYQQGELEPMLAKTILWFRENAYRKERLGAAIDRLGVEAFEAAVAGDELLQRQAAILAAPLKERNA